MLSVSALTDHYSCINIAGEILQEIIPAIYNQPRNITISKDGGKFDVLKINESNEATGNIKNDISKIFSRTLIKIQMSPISEVKKQNNLESIGRMVSSDPNLMSISADLMALSLDTTEGDVLARRIQASMDPELIKVGDGIESVSDYQEKQQKAQSNQPQQPDPIAIRAKIDGQNLQLKAQELYLKSKEIMQTGQKDQAEHSIAMQKVNQEMVKNQNDLMMSIERLKAEKQTTDTQQQIKLLEIHKKELDSSLNRLHSTYLDSIK